MSGRYGDETTVLGILSGGTVTIELWDLSDGSTVTLTSNSCTQVGSTYAYRWCSSGITTQPTSEIEYMYKMTSSVNAADVYYGQFSLQCEDVVSVGDIADAVWDEIKKLIPFTVS